ncbi:unnamed protein product [Amoebophrya sp. A120]|nr:unnamed protein product [Amoebophrya sp. A120]|eukprot:GSA120T00012319001.1
MQPAYQAVGKEALMAKSEEVRKAFGGVWRFSFFLCAFLCVASGVLATICAVWSFLPPFDFINFVFLTLFGCVMLLQEAPVDNRYVELFRQTMHTYALALTRFTGKGCLYLFLGSMAFGALWDNDIAPFLGFILGGIIVAVAIASLIVGYRMTMQLEKVRQAVLAEGTEKWSAYIPPYPNENAYAPHNLHPRALKHLSTYSKKQAGNAGFSLGESRVEHLGSQQYNLYDVDNGCLGSEQLSDDSSSLCVVLLLAREHRSLFRSTDTQ